MISVLASTIALKVWVFIVDDASLAGRFMEVKFSGLSLLVELSF